MRFLSPRNWIWAFISMLTAGVVIVWAIGALAKPPFIQELQEVKGSGIFI